MAVSWRYIWDWVPLAQRLRSSYNQGQDGRPFPLILEEGRSYVPSSRRFDQIEVALNPKMATVWGNEDVACYFTTKHSWRGKWVECFGCGIDAACHHMFSADVVVFTSIALLSADFLAVTCRYKRIFSIGTKGITTYNPANLEVTNQVRMDCSKLTLHSCDYLTYTVKSLNCYDVIFLNEYHNSNFMCL